jgi:UDP-2-acetamido-3-amino-2,3-dideoxy-glucuronate N-acetyltransferase
MGNQNGKVNVCVVGCGHWGKNLVRNFHALGDLYAFCESSDALRESFRGQYPSAKAYDSLDAALADRDIDAFVLATPAEQHFPMGMRVLEAGKDIYVEKPLALEWEEGLRLVERARQDGMKRMRSGVLRRTIFR